MSAARNKNSNAIIWSRAACSELLGAYATD